MALVELTVGKALDALGQLPSASAHKAHIDFLKDKFETAEKEIAKLTNENLQLLRETKQLQAENEKLKREKFEAVLADIGPCKIKIDATGHELPGYYCLKCNGHLDRGDCGWGEDHLVCQHCRDVHCDGKFADKAREAFVLRNDIKTIPISLLGIVPPNK